MTFSIVAFNEKTGTAGAASMTGGIAVGGFVCHARAGVGAIATQGIITNWLYGSMGLSVLEKEQISAQQTLDYLTDKDKGRDFRQCIIVDQTGSTAGWTGSNNIESLAIQHGDGVITAGNMLANDDIPAAMLDRFESLGSKVPLCERLLQAMTVGLELGGDKRGTFSAALKVDYYDLPPLDLRVDLAKESLLDEFRELYERFYVDPFASFYQSAPTRKNFSKTGDL